MFGEADSLYLFKLKKNNQEKHNLWYFLKLIYLLKPPEATISFFF